MNIQKAQGYLSKQSIDAWLIYDFRGSNPVMKQALGDTAVTTRRSIYYIPQSGNPVLLHHALDNDAYLIYSGDKKTFTTWQEFQRELEQMLSGMQKVAMEYSPNGMLPIVSWVDHGTIELIKLFGVEVVSSADVFQIAAAAWSPDDHASHLTAVTGVMETKDYAFEFICSSLAAGKRITEYDVQQFILSEFEKRDLEVDHPPLCAVNEHSGDPHYEPGPLGSSVIKQSDWVLIDLWARQKGFDSVFADVTWVGYAGDSVPEKHQEVFGVVKQARDDCVARLEEAWSSREVLKGFELDDVARQVITDAGYGEYFIHRTGHSLGRGGNVHALGVNLDNYETHDNRQILPGTGFTIEPGIYLPEFGMRLEINVYMDPEKGPTVTTPSQNEIVLL